MNFELFDGKNNSRMQMNKQKRCKHVGFKHMQIIDSNKCYRVDLLLQPHHNLCGDRFVCLLQFRAVVRGALRHVGAMRRPCDETCQCAWIDV